MPAGRKSKYDSHVKPRFPEIQSWLEAGATEKEVCDNLGVNSHVFCEYKTKYPELAELVKNARLKPVQDIKAALFKRATGFHYTEKTVTNSEKNGLTVQTFTKYALPDPTAAMMLLRHWDTETEWTNDPAVLNIRKQELELKKQQAEMGDW